MQRSKLASFGVALAGLMLMTSPAEAANHGGNVQDLASQGNWLSTQPDFQVGAPATVTVRGQGANYIDIHVEVSGMSIVPGTGDSSGYSDVKIPGAGWLSEVGLPAVPTVARWIAVPSGAELSFELLDEDVSEYKVGAMMPVQPLRVRDGSPAPAFTVNQGFYSSSSAYPSTAAKLGDINKIRQQSMVRLEAHPVRYFPAKGKVEVARSMDIRIHFSGNFTRGTATAPDVSTYNHLLNRMVLGRDRNFAQARGPKAPESMLVITDEKYMDTIQPWVNWKTRRGLNVMVKKGSEIGTTAEKYQEFIKSSYDADKTLTYVQLVGKGLPTFTVKSNSDTDGKGESDYKMTMLDGDHLGDVMIGRYLARNEDDLKTMINKVIVHERDMGREGFDDSWANRATGIGSEQQNGSDSRHIDKILKHLESKGFVDSDRFLGADGWKNPKDVIEAVGEGRSWILYMGHGDGESWQFKNRFYFGIPDVEKIQNGNMWPLIADCACSNGYWLGNKVSFVEAWMSSGTPEKPRGSLAMLSSTVLAAWYEPATMEEGMAVASVDKSQIWGEIIEAGRIFMEEEFGKTTTVTQSQETFTNFSDPSLFFRNQPGTKLDVDHPSTVAAGKSDLKVTVKANGGSALGEAVVALSSTDGTSTLWGVGLTDSSGVATIALDHELDEGDMMDIVVTGYNLVTYEGELKVGAGDDDDDAEETGTGDDDDDADDDDDDNDDDDADDDDDDDADDDDDDDDDSSSDDDDDADDDDDDDDDDDADDDDDDDSTSPSAGEESGQSSDDDDDDDAGTTPGKKTKGCSTVSASESDSALWLGALGVGLVSFRRRRRN